MEIVRLTVWLVIIFLSAAAIVSILVLLTPNPNNRSEDVEHQVNMAKKKLLNKNLY